MEVEVVSAMLREQDRILDDIQQDLEYIWARLQNCERVYLPFLYYNDTVGLLKEALEQQGLTTELSKDTLMVY